MTKKDFSLSDIEVKKDVALLVRLKGITFARTLLWLSIKFENPEGFIYTSELSHFLKTTQSYAYSLLKEFENFRLVTRDPAASNMVMWRPVLNSKHPVLNKYIMRAKKTLNIGI